MSVSMKSIVARVFRLHTSMDLERARREALHKGIGLGQKREPIYVPITSCFNAEKHRRPVPLSPDGTCPACQAWLRAMQREQEKRPSAPLPPPQTDMLTYFKQHPGALTRRVLRGDITIQKTQLVGRNQEPWLNDQGLMDTPDQETSRLRPQDAP